MMMRFAFGTKMMIIALATTITLVVVLLCSGGGSSPNKAASILDSSAASPNNTALIVDSGGASPSKKTALILDRVPYACAGCDEAMERMIEYCEPEEWEFKRVTTDANNLIDRTALENVDLFIAPGGEAPNDFTDAFKLKKTNEIMVIKEWVANGGHYLGSCFGAYLIGNAVFQFKEMPYKQEFIVNPEIPDENDYNVDIVVKYEDDITTTSSVYFQDGPYLKINPRQMADVDVLATFAGSGHPAAVVFPYGGGTVGATSCHFEGHSGDEDGATWHQDYELGCEVINAIMA